MSSFKDPAYISAISPLTSANYGLWADDMKSWLQLNGLWRRESGEEKKPAAKPEINDSKGQVVSKAVALDEENPERWEIKAERAAGALKTCMCLDVKVLIRDCEDDPILI